MSSTSTLIHPTTSTTAPYTTFSPGSSSAGPASATEPCPHCGAPANLLPSASDDAQRRISELEQQVRLLSDKATAAADKLADYEDSLRRSSAPPHPPPTEQAQQQQQPPDRPSSRLQSRLSALLTSSSSSISKRPFSPPMPSPSPTPTPTTLPTPSHPPLHPTAPAPTTTTTPSTISEQLSHEISLRRAAEARYAKAQEEVEELSSALFQEANEMVAKERKERRKAEEKVEGLERRAQRWEVLERRVGRGERVRGLLAEGEGG